MSYADYEIQFAVYFFHCTNVMVKCMPKNCFDGNFFKPNIFFYLQAKLCGSFQYKKFQCGSHRFGLVGPYFSTSFQPNHS